MALAGAGVGEMSATSGDMGDLQLLGAGMSRAAARAPTGCTMPTPILRVSATGSTREPSWSIHTVGTSTIRRPASRAASSRSTSNRRSVRRCAGRSARRPRGAGPSRRTGCRGTAGRAGGGRRTRSPRSSAGAARCAGAAAPTAGWWRLAIAPSTPVLGRVGEPQQLGRRRRAVGVDEADEVGVGAPEGLGDHPALAELGVLEEAARGGRARRASARSRPCGRCRRRPRPGTARPSPGQPVRYACRVRSIRCSSLCAGMTMSSRKKPPVARSVCKLTGRRAGPVPAACPSTHCRGRSLRDAGPAPERRPYPGHTGIHLPVTGVTETSDRRSRRPPLSSD